MSRTLPRASAAKRRGVVLAVAAGALALGAAAPASASASQSSSASASAAKGKTSHGPALCVIRADDDSATPTTPTTPTKPGKVVEHAKPGKLTEAGKVAGKKAIAVSKDRSRGHDDTCVAIPAFPTDPGKACKVVVIKRGSGKPDSVPAFPTKPGKHTTPTTPTKPGKPGKPGKICVIVVPKDGHRATKPSSDAKTTAVEATRATRS
ncbi:hypothetical protein [Streptomyces iranensis]|uniref:hypothetical protein n=1 Tax=Streptomyces iranensis TaxID=576784 RepID=UPI0039B75DEF